MVFKSYRYAIVFQIIFIALTPAIFLKTIHQEYMVVTSTTLIVLWLGQIVCLIWYLEKVVRDLARFFKALRFSDISTNFINEKKKDPYFKQLYDELNFLKKELANSRSEKEIHYQYLQNTVKHINIGIIVFDKTGKVELINNATLQLLNVKSLKNIHMLDDNLSMVLSSMKPETNKLHKVLRNNETIQLLLKASYFKLKNRGVRLVSLQNIKSEIDQSEVDAWQKLMRILTHEIMNSVSPVKLLSGSLISMFEENNKIKPIDSLSNETIENTVLGLKTIRKRSNGLSNFIETYKSFTSKTKVKFSSLNVSRLFDTIEALLLKELQLNNIALKVYCASENLVINADEKLLEQVLINLIKNSSEALNGTPNPEIILKAQQVNRSIEIQIVDNGCGISDKIVENIFVPFFTTKEKGSGVGLSFSRQIMHLHQGNIFVKSKPNETIFTLLFPFYNIFE
ncbi:MAG: ATP-binding protein [Bacteroidales bacterium]|nr:ATP-binding protein [Bacteroidales bacterium]